MQHVPDKAVVTVTIFLLYEAMESTHSGLWSHSEVSWFGCLEVYRGLCSFGVEFCAG